ncbi:hypothetical protein B0H19DRAFT_1105222 [Mycena capillaripes]|nr:hypothetical protein B0H19DRAFT_1105222 [Mycena capillaripes]
MAATPISLYNVVLEQTARTKGSSKAEIQEFIEGSMANITSLESEIAALAERRDRERAIVAVLGSFIAPISTLPVELLAEVFVLAIQQHWPDLEDQ